MPLSWNEIKSRALLFIQEWKDEVREEAETKSFWDDFFNLFGISRPRVASYELQVQINPCGELGNRTSGEKAKHGYIDLL